METHHTFIVNHERFLSLMAYGSKDLKLPKSKDIFKLRELFAEIALENKMLGRSESKAFD